MVVVFHGSVIFVDYIDEGIDKNKLTNNKSQVLYQFLQKLSDKITK